MPALTREEWLNAASTHLLARIASSTKLEAPAAVQVSVGFPRKDREGQVIGQCWPTTSGKGVSQVFISPLLDDPTGHQGVLATLLHELLHAADDCASSHGPKFGRAVKAVGLKGKPTATLVEDDTELAYYLETVAGWLGPYPHAALTPGWTMTKKQTTRMIKCSCEECGYTVRTTQKWIDVAVVTCPDEECGSYGYTLTQEEK